MPPSSEKLCPTATKLPSAVSMMSYKTSTLVPPKLSERWILMTHSSLITSISNISHAVKSSNSKINGTSIIPFLLKNILVPPFQWLENVCKVHHFYGKKIRKDWNARRYPCYYSLVAIIRQGFTF